MTRSMFSFFLAIFSCGARSTQQNIFSSEDDLLNSDSSQEIYHLSAETDASLFSNSEFLSEFPYDLDLSCMF